MLGIKTLNLARLGICLFLVTVFLITAFWARISTFSRQLGYGILHYLTGKEVSLRTKSFLEVRTPHFIIKYEPVDEAYIALIEDTAEEAYASVSEVFDREPEQVTTIVVYPDSTSLASSFGWDKNEKALGVYWGGSIRILSPRDWLNGEDIEAKFRKDGPMNHEMAHLLVDDITRGNYNRWWTEGIAQYVEKKTTGFEFADPFVNRGVTEYYEFSQLEKKFDQLDQQVAYWQSLKAVEYIAAFYGEARLFSILNCLGKGNTMGQAIQNALGIDMKTFESRFMENAVIL
ncbi:MAG: peptidase MA family metallohydrolase [Syntrophomonadaceae bacterium]